MGRIFLSYRRGDTGGYAGRLYDDLAAALGEDNVFRDLDTIGPGVDFTRAITEAIAACDLVLAVIGPQWLDATKEGRRRLDDPEDFVRLELGSALSTEKALVPVLVGNATLPAASALPEPLKPLVKHNAIEVSDERWDYDIGRLVAAARQIAGIPEQKQAPAVPEAPPPPAPARRPPAARRSGFRPLKTIWSLMGFGLLIAMFAFISKAVDDGTVTDVATGGNESDEASADVTPATRQVDKTVWFQGFELAFTTAELHVGEQGPQVDLSVQLENESPIAVNLGDQVGFNAAFLSSGGDNFPLDGGELPLVPGKAKGRAIMTFHVDGDFSLDDAVLTMGHTKNNQTVLPLGAGGEAVPRAPRPLEIAGALQAGQIAIDANITEVRWDVLFDEGQPTPVPKGRAGLAVVFDARTTARYGYNFGVDGLALRLPDGTTVFSDYCCGCCLGPQQPADDLAANFVVSDPPNGEYTLILTALDDDGQKKQASFRFKIE